MPLKTDQTSTAIQAEKPLGGNKKGQLLLRDYRRNSCKTASYWETAQHFQVHLACLISEEEVIWGIGEKQQQNP